MSTYLKLPDLQTMHVVRSDSRCTISSHEDSSNGSMSSSSSLSFFSESLVIAPIATADQATHLLLSL